MDDRTPTGAGNPDTASGDAPMLGLSGGTAAPQGDKGYQVLARKYRPDCFADLIGQEALVRTLTNAIATNRLAHAYILTGVRGVGKTTTARILARCLNYEAESGDTGPTANPEKEGIHCTAIAQSRHVDVIEMDAASRTGIDDIREIIEGSRYKPASARYKIYIIDEVHMLSKAAFNGLLKTLEEPPAHVIFIFATTEIRKVPITVLSRCQRFNLRRVGVAELSTHLAGIAESENASVSAEALAIIARAAEGSVRDALSLLDQAIAQGDGTVGPTEIRDMMGLADRARIFDLFAAVMGGDMPGALNELQSQYAAGADPLIVLTDLLELSHWLTRIKLVPAATDDAGLPEAERSRGRELAEKLSMPELTRAWQILLKGLGEAREAPDSLSAVEMVLIRLGYAASLPTPGDIVRQLSATPTPQPSGAAASAGSPPKAATQASSQPSATATTTGGGMPSQAGAAANRPMAQQTMPDQPAPAQARGSAGITMHAQQAPLQATAIAPQSALAPADTDIMHTRTQPDPAQPAPVSFHPPKAAGAADAGENHAAYTPASLRELVALATRHRAIKLKTALMQDMHLVHFEPGRIEFRPTETASPKLAAELGDALQKWTGTRWIVSVGNATGAPTLAEQEAEAAAKRRDAALRDPLVQQVLETFPGAEIIAVRDQQAPGLPEAPLAPTSSRGETE